MKFDQVGELPKSTSKSTDRLKGLEKWHYLIQITAYRKSIVFTLIHILFCLSKIGKVYLPQFSGLENVKGTLV